MKISILSDFHFGYASGSEREDDFFEAAEEAIGEALDSDIIILAGDIFDSRTPSTETFVRAMEILSRPVFQAKSQARVVNAIGREIGKPLNPAGIPVIAIHGTHERRVKGFLNPVEALERAGFLTYLHCNGVVLQKGDELVCVQGMSGVPEHYAESVLKEWSPRPRSGYNILLFHQSISPFMYATHMLDLEKIPRGFDLYVNGHVHEPKKAEYSGAPFLIPGSLVPTQMGKDSLTRKGFFRVDTQKGKIEFIELEGQRDFYYEEVESLQEAAARIKSIVGKKHAKKPIISLRVPERGPRLEDIRKKYSDSAIIYYIVRGEKQESPGEARTLEEHRLSVRELGSKLLREALQKEGLDPKVFEHVFELLEEKKSGEALEYLKKRAGS
jgi:DNA repair exonuclease SbcCD nuclease subunit